MPNLTSRPVNFSPNTGSEMLLPEWFAIIALGAMVLGYAWLAVALWQNYLWKASTYVRGFVILWGSIAFWGGVLGAAALIATRVIVVADASNETKNRGISASHYILVWPVGLRYSSAPAVKFGFLTSSCDEIRAMQTCVINDSSRPARIETVKYGTCFGASRATVDIKSKGVLTATRWIDTVGPGNPPPGTVTVSVKKGSSYYGCVFRDWLTW